MLRGMRLIALVIALLTLVTVAALESGDVIRVETVNAQTQQLRETRIWFVHSDERLVLEAGKPDHPWVLDIMHVNHLRLSGQGLDGKYQSRLLGPDSHDEIRRLMRAKYGWRDVWVGWIFDTSRSRMVLVEAIANSS